MNRRLRSGKRWETGRFALLGALLGMVLGIMEQFCNAFCPDPWRHIPEGNLFAHVLTEVVIGAAAGAALFVAIAAIRNWLLRDTAGQ